MNLSEEIDRQLDDMLQRTLAGEIIPFDQWQDLLEDIQEEPEESVDDILRQRGLTLMELAAQAEQARAAFLKQLKKFGFPLENRFALCQALCQEAERAPSDELLRLYCDIVEDGGYLLDLERIEAPQAALSWLYGKEDADRLYTHLHRRAQLADHFCKVLNRAKQINPPPEVQPITESALLEPLYKMYAGIYLVKDCGPQFRDNLAWLLHLADAVPELSLIKPLFLYQMLIRHERRIRTSEEIRINFKALWNYREYRFEENNGKNYAANVCRLRLFGALCRLYGQDGQVDLPLCICGFEQLSNLGEFYRMWSPDPSLISFEPSLEDFLNESMFSCFEYGSDDNIMLADSELTQRKLDRFCCSEDPHRVRALELISVYMNQNLSELIQRFSSADSEGIRALCREILACAELPNDLQPKESEETVLLLAAINEGLMEVVDGLAEELLVQAGRALIGIT